VTDAGSWITLVLVLAVTAVYVRGRLLAPADPHATVLALAGLAVLAVSVSPAAHVLARRGLESHMAQHVALVIAAAPLIVLGHPGQALLLGLPRWARPPFVHLGRLLPRTSSPTGIWIVTLVHGAAFWLWHDPDLYDAAVRNGGLHVLEHATFVLTALVYWWTIVHAGEGGERGYVLAMLASVVTVIQGSVLGLLMLVANTSWYSVYAGSNGALSDQQGAAALMWGITGSVYMLATAVLLWRLLAALDGRAAA
jgi:putative membrane protein